MVDDGVQVGLVKGGSVGILAIYIARQHPSRLLLGS